MATISKEGGSCDLNFIDVSAVTNFDEIFKGTFFSGNVSNWNIAQARSANEMFKDTLFNGDLSKWSVSALVNSGGVDNMLDNQTFSGHLSPWGIAALVAKQHARVNQILLAARKMATSPKASKYHAGLTRFSKKPLLDFYEHQEKVLNIYTRIFGNQKKLVDYTSRIVFDVIHFDLCCQSNSPPSSVTLDQYEWSLSMYEHAKNWKLSYLETHQLVQSTLACRSSETYDDSNLWA